MTQFKLYRQDRRRYKTDLAHVRPWFKTRSGITLKLRLMQPEDTPLLIDFFERLSPESRWRRFHANVEHVSPELIQKRACELADVDNRVMQGGVVAVLEEADGEHIVGTVRLARPYGQPEATEAEAAVVVRDDFQGQGLGAELLRRMVLLARQMGVQTIVAIFQSDNENAVRLFRELNLPSTFRAAHGEIEMRIEVPTKQ